MPSVARPPALPWGRLIEVLVPHAPGPVLPQWAIAGGRGAARGIPVEVLKIALVVGAGGLMVLGWRGMSLGMSEMFRPLRDGLPAENGACRLVRFPIFGGLIIAFSGTSVLTPVVYGPRDVLLLARSSASSG